MRLLILTATALLPTNALGHEGGHLHPHGLETGYFILLAAIALVVAAYVVRR